MNDPTIPVAKHECKWCFREFCHLANGNLCSDRCVRLKSEHEQRAKEARARFELFKQQIKRKQP